MPRPDKLNDKPKKKFETLNSLCNRCSKPLSETTKQFVSGSFYCPQCTTLLRGNRHCCICGKAMSAKDDMTQVDTVTWKHTACKWQATNRW